jgi:hypothetical protein
MRGMLPIRRASGRELVAVVVREQHHRALDIDVTGRVLGHHGQLIQETSEMISERLALDQDREERFRAGIDKAVLLEKPRIHIDRAAPTLSPPCRSASAAEGSDRLRLPGRSLVRTPRGRRLADLPDEAKTTYRMTSRSPCVILCDSTPPTNALRVRERVLQLERRESPRTTREYARRSIPERRYERGGSSPPVD